MVKAVLSQLQQAGRIRPLDEAFGQFIAAQESGWSAEQQTNLGLLAAHLSNRLGEQDSCLQLSLLAQPFAEFHQFPAVEQLHQQLSQANSVAVIRSAGDVADKPLVLEGNKLYLQRYWQYERELARLILAKAANSLDLDVNAAKKILNRLFTGVTDAEANSATQVDWQKVAVCIAASQQLTLITGGPGTGKTTTVTRLMALLQGLAKIKGQSLSIKLVAPTGKAAARLSQSINSAKSKLPEDLSLGLPDQCSTVHRLLGAKPFSPYFKFNAHNPLHLDVLVLDEASMVDLPLMSKLFAALPQHAQIILLGDKDQLASVEAGSVLSDICAAAFERVSKASTQFSYSAAMIARIEQLSGYALPVGGLSTTAIGDNLVVLQKSHRFSAESAVGQLANAINLGQYQQSLNLLMDKTQADIDWYENSQQHHLVAQLMPTYTRYFAAIEAGNVAKAFECLQQQQVLCAQKSGEWGVHRLNKLIENELYKQGFIDTSRAFYSGRPIMLNQNDHNQKLFNGDIGIVMADPEQAELQKIWFISAEGQIRGLLSSRLPAHETLYAMTIHKSQGSEFEHVYLCLPDIKHLAGAKGLSRELLYTGLTRAKQSFSLYASQQALQLSLQQQCKRGSGLAERLATTLSL
ncbi:MAG: exodeoxyribonuclease V alpha subunit [Paraglaciecola sp.]|jgi:exodeoxyribonuclease V alpha subunit